MQMESRRVRFGSGGIRVGAPLSFASVKSNGFFAQMGVDDRGSRMVTKLVPLMSWKQALRAGGATRTERPSIWAEDRTG